MMQWHTEEWRTTVRLVRFETRDGNEVWINPNRVFTVEKSTTGDSTIITDGQRFAFVTHSQEEAALKLTGQYGCDEEGCDQMAADYSDYCPDHYDE